MTLQDTLTLVRAALRSVGYFLSGRIRFPHDRLGYVLEQPDGGSFLVYRETALQPAVEEPPTEGVVLVFRVSVTQEEVGSGLRDVLFDPLANVATPFFAGMPGFRRKLWLAGERQGEFLELYEWDTEADANRFADVVRSLLAPFEFAGSASFEVDEADSIDEYVATHSVRWRDRATEYPGGRRRERPVRLAALALAVAVAGYLLWRRGVRSG